MTLEYYTEYLKRCKNNQMPRVRAKGVKEPLALHIKFDKGHLDTTEKMWTNETNVETVWEEHRAVHMLHPNMKTSCQR